MAALLIATAVLLIVSGRAEEVAAWLLPAIPPHLGAIALLGTLSLIATLIIPPTRMLATIVITGTFTGLLYAARAIVTASLSTIRAIFRLGYSAWRAPRN